MKAHISDAITEKLKRYTELKYSKITNPIRIGKFLERQKEIVLKKGFAMGATISDLEFPIAYTIEG